MRSGSQRSACFPTIFRVRKYQLASGVALHSPKKAELCGESCPLMLFFARSSKNDEIIPKMV
jgi:hypothetical protein